MINVCYDLQSEELNCGMCGNRCMAGDGGMATCSSGMCL